MALEFAGAAARLQPGDIEAEAAALACSPAALHMFVDVESRGSGFLPDGRPVILCERHLFSRFTGHKFDSAHPDISNPAPGGYGLGGAHQYDRLTAMVRLDRTAALRATSWGLGQVLGNNFAMTGFTSAEAFVAAMGVGERPQLEAMLAYLKAAKLVRFLQSAPPNFALLAAGYNGAGAVAHYAAALAAAYAKWVAHPAAPASYGPIARATHPPEWHAPAAAAGAGAGQGTPAAAQIPAAPNHTVGAPQDPEADADTSAEALNRAELSRL